MEKLELIWSGETELPVGWVLQPHAHDFFHLAYVCSGQLSFWADKQTYPMTEGSLILLPPGVVHAVPEDGHNLCTQYEVMFRIADPELQTLFDTKKVLVLHNASHLEPLFFHIFTHYKSIQPVCAASTDAFLCAILFSFLTDKTNSEGDSAGYVDAVAYSPLIQRILSQVEKDSDRKYDLSELARTLGFNKNYLCTVFHRETGVTISEYVNYHRIRKILITLQYNGYNKDFPLQEIADQNGYANASYFNRVFKKYTGMTPTEFINALSNAPEQSAFQKYYTEYLDLKHYPIKESLEYMQGLKVASTTGAIEWE